ncbi:MAG TPA: ABC transporter permease subunit [Jatrophihabitantaceae bacterium]|jgi:putative spermidine/putrescine transport system permease protein|nr:ABC transporter permease subunit [Jatrophihabitantaceae bacterium]
MTTTGYGSAAVPELVPSAPVDQHPPRRNRGRASGAISRRLVLLVAAIYFIGPFIAGISFTLQNPRGGLSVEAYKQIFAKPAIGQIGFTTALVYSLEIALITIVLTLGLMLPTQLLLHLRLPRWRGIVEIMTLLPLVFPPVVLVVGVDDVYKWAQPKHSGVKGSQLFSILNYIKDGTHPLLLAMLYVILSMPFVYRALDAGIRSIDAQTLVEASRNLGASWVNVLVRVLMPALRTAIINAGFLCFALVMGEYTIASILLYTKPFPVWLAQLPTTSGQVQAAVSVFSLLLVEVLLLLVGALNWRRATEKKG